MKQFPENSLLIFAGPGGITEKNLDAQLNQWLPAGLRVDVPVIPASIPASHAGLRRVRDWLIASFRQEGVDELGDLPAFIGNLEDTHDTFLVVLWGEGDEPTERLIDAAMKRDIPVLSLADGMDTLVLGDRKPPEEAAPARRARRARTQPEDTAADEAPASTQAAPAPWEPDRDAEKAPDLRPVRTLAYVLADGLRACADRLMTFAENGEAASAAPEAAAPEAQPRARPRTAGATRAWFKDPGKDEDDPAAYVLRGRGQPRRPYKDWPVCDLTEERERELGLPART